MMKRRILILTICCISGISIILILSLLAKKTMSLRNGFVRLLPSHKIIGEHHRNIDYNSWYIAGADSSYLYLANYITIDRLLRIDKELKDTSIYKVNWPNSVRIHNGATIAVDPPYIYLSDGIKPGVFYGSLLNHNLKALKETPYFTLSIPLSPSTYVFRTVINSKSNILIKQRGREIFRPQIDLLQKQIDGIFSTDGTWVRAENSDKLIYLYYYRNQFICTDTSLNLLYRGKTIDTVSKANIQVAYIPSLHQFTLTNHPMQTNSQCSANKAWLFIHCNLKADNEIKEVFDKGSLIDVYEINNGKYHFSLYLPDFQGSKIRNFKVYGKSLYALYDHYIYQYKLNF